MARFVVTPTHIVAAYEFLRAMPLFARWKLPHADEVEFRVLLARDRGGHFRGGLNGTPSEIAVTAADVSHARALLEIVGHEMIHLYQHVRGSETADAHNDEFCALAGRVCRPHGFAPASFAA